MFRIDWSNPKVTISDVEQVVQANIPEIYDGLLVENGYLYVVTTSPMTSEQEDNIKNIIYTLNQQPISVITQPITVASSPAFSSKTITVNGVTKKLYARNTGFQVTLTAGSNTVTYTATYPWVKLIGVEVIGAETLDYVDMKVYDNSSGTYSGVPNYMLNQFAYSVNIPKDYYIRLSQFDADMYINMVVEFTYHSVSDKTIGINLIMNEVKS